MPIRIAEVYQAWPGVTASCAWPSNRNSYGERAEHSASVVGK
jgi:hypothetical protein